MLKILQGKNFIFQIFGETVPCKCASTGECSSASKQATNQT